MTATALPDHAAIVSSISPVDASRRRGFLYPLPCDAAVLEQHHRDEHLMRSLARLFLAAPLIASGPALALDPSKVPSVTLGAGSNGDGSSLSAKANGATSSQTFGAWLSSVILGVPTVGGLRTYPTAILFNGAVIHVGGYNTFGDGGNGTYRWASTSTAADDGMLVIAPTGNAGAGRWLRQWDGALSIQAAGAVCDGSTDASFAAQRVVTALGPTGGRLIVPAGASCRVGLTWTSGRRLVIEGQGQSSTLMPASPTGTILAATNGTTQFRDLIVYSPNGYSTAGWLFDLSGGTHSLTNVYFAGGYDLVRFGNACRNCGASDIVVDGPKRNGFWVDVSPPTGQQYGIVTFARMKLQADSSNVGDGLTLVSGDTVWVSDSNFAGFNRGVVAKTSATRGYLANLFFNAVSADGAGGPDNSSDGWVFDGTAKTLTRINFINPWAAFMGGRGMYFKNVSDIDMTAARVIVNGRNGIELDTGVRAFKMIGGTVAGNSRIFPNKFNGIQALAGANNLTFAYVRSGPAHTGVDESQSDSQVCGLSISSTSITDYRVESGDFRGNLAGPGGGAPPYGLCDGGGGTAAPPEPR